jgi:hypothetical protein
VGVVAALLLLKLTRDSPVAFYNIRPLTDVCLDPRCEEDIAGVSRPREIREPLIIPVTVFTQDFGSLPGNAISLYCRGTSFPLPGSSGIHDYLPPGCKTRYYSNYYVHTDSAGIALRSYYLSKPAFIHSADHVFLDERTCEIFSTMMVNSW